ncbi:MAG: hypothetical protein OCC49_17785 [Fibrobacterales bacterium]
MEQVVHSVLNENTECSDTQENQSFDKDCLASLAIGTFKEQGAYTVIEYVLDHLGQYISLFYP